MTDLHNPPTQAALARPEDPRVPPIGSVSQAERMCRVNWVTAERRGVQGEALLLPDYVSRQGRFVRVIDLRDSQSMIGPLGYVPDSDWFPQEDWDALLAQAQPKEPLVLVSLAHDKAAAALALRLEAAGCEFAAILSGGIEAWRTTGLSVSRDPEIFSRRATLRALPASSFTGVTAPVLDEDAIRAHVGDPRNVRRVRLGALLNHGRMSCVDGRDGTAIIGVPGGDAGEFILALGAYEDRSGSTLSTADIHGLLQARLDAFGSFYIHSDVNASNSLIKSLRADPRFDAALESVFHTLEWRRFMNSPPPSVRAALLEHMLIPENIGCGHLRLSLLHAEDYGVRRALAEDVLRSLFLTRWAGACEPDYVVLPGGHAEQAVLSVTIEAPLDSFSWVPLISPSTARHQVFVMHPQVIAHQRHALSAWLASAAPTPLPTASLCAATASLGSQQASHTLHHLAHGLPSFSIHFGPNNSLHVS